MPPCDDQIPRECSDEFSDIKGRLGIIEMKIDQLCDSRRMITMRLWGVLKGVVLLVIGAVIAHLSAKK